MFNLRKLVVYFLVLIVMFIFFKRDIFTFFQEKVNKQETVSLKANEEKLDRKDVIKKIGGTSSLDTLILEKNYLPRYNENAQIRDIDVIPEELIALETLAKENNGLDDNIEPNASEVTPQELLDMEYSVAQELKEKSGLVEPNASEVTPQELLDMEYSVAQEAKEGSGLVEIKSSNVTPQKLLDLERFSKKHGELGFDSSAR